jgi:TonB family protein
VILLLLKVTLVAALALVWDRLSANRSAALRHLLCAVGLGTVVVLPATLFSWLTPPIPLPGVFRIVLEATAQPVRTSAGQLTMQLRVLAAAWLVGSLGMLARLLFGHWTAIRATRRGIRIDTEAPIRIRTAEVSAPLVTGLWNPTVLVPESLPTWPRAQRDAAIQHELAHVDRLDLWTTLLAQIACVLYWFHPFVWALARRTRTLQELACDDAVLSTGLEPVVYAEALVAVARHFTPTPRTAGPLIGCHMLTKQSIKENALKTRIARLVDGNLPRVDSKSAMRKAGVAFVALAACIGLANAGPQASPTPTGPTLKMGPGITSPKVLHKIDPSYTEEARAAKISGTVLMQVTVGTDGKAHEISVLDTPDAGLGRKAVEAVQQWIFEPATKDGQAVNVLARIEVNFKLL